MTSTVCIRTRGTTAVSAATIRNGSFGNKALDYGVPEVREHILRVVRDLAERYDMDGLDLDFMRWPVYFKSDEVKANTPLMTDFRGSAPSLTKQASGAGTSSQRPGAAENRRGQGLPWYPPDVHEVECLGPGLDQSC